MDTNHVQNIFLLIAVATGVLGLLINCLEPHLPVWVVSSYRYGKFSLKDHYSALQVPKRWFKHFYIFAGPASVVVLLLVLYKYLFNGTLPEIVLTALDTSLSSTRKALVPAENVFVAALILSIHCCKRTYESCYVSIFSDQKMSISHYLVGFLHYIGTFICVIGEAEGFVRGTDVHSFSWDKVISTKLVYASFILLWATSMQYQTNVILRNLRKGKDADVSYAYKVPVNGLFKYISAPLQFTEIIIYLALSVMLWPASTFHYITLWVISNQVECAFLSHEWYRATFKQYPNERKILIPFVW